MNDFIHQKALRFENSIPELLAALGHGYALSGRRAEGLKTVRGLQDRSQREFVSSYSIFTIYIGPGMKDEAHLMVSKGLYFGFRSVGIG
jgi:hypothetical protein